MKHILVGLGLTCCLIYFAIVCLTLQGCTLIVNDDKPTTPYCFADHECSWYDENGIMHTEWLCQEEMMMNMTCK